MTRHHSLLDKEATPGAARGRLIRVVDATTAPKASPEERRRNGVWRVHAAFDLPSERFGHFEVTDQNGGEPLDRIPVVKGEIRLADAAYIQPERIAAVLDGGGDVVVRMAWRNGRWLNQGDETLDFAAAFKAARDGLIDQPIQLCRKHADPLPLRLIARRLPPDAVETARRRARSAAKKKGSVRRGSGGRGMGDVGDVAERLGVPGRRGFGLVSFAMACGTGLQTPQERDRLEGASEQGPAHRQGVHPGAFTDDFTARTADRGVRGRSTLGERRLTRPGAWHLLRQLVLTFLQAIAPQPCLLSLLDKWSVIQRNMHEPPRRKRVYQNTAGLGQRLWAEAHPPSLHHPAVRLAAAG